MNNRSLSALLFAGFVAGAGCNEGQTAFTGKRDDQHPRLNDENPPTLLCEDACRKVPVACRELDCVRTCTGAVGKACEIEVLALARCIAYRGSVVCESEQRGQDQPPRFTQRVDGCDREEEALERCVDPGVGGAAGRGGAAGEGGVGGDAGDAGSAGDAGTAGDAGSAGMMGRAGDAGSAGMMGTAGSAGMTGSGGTGGSGDGGPDAVGGSSGMGGTQGSAGTGGMDASPDTGGQCVLPNCTGCADPCQTCLCTNAGDSGACSVECTPDGGVDSGADTSTE